MGFRIVGGDRALGCFESWHAEDLIIGSFRGESFGAWKTTGTAFNSGPVSKEMLARLEIENSVDDAVASSEVDGDGPMGTLTSPEFEIARKYIAFRIAGGDYERDTCLNLIVGGEIVKSATGWRSDRLTPMAWEVRRFLGRTATIQIVDAAKGDWGHINVERIIQTDEPEQLPEPQSPLYQEPWRPQFHFTARQWTMDRLNPGPKQEGWINDLNGLIYYDGEYHLFAQRWWKCWLHAVSSDLIHWRELKPAFWEESNETGTQSGTCVVDYHNTSGLSPDASTPPMVAFWSRNDNQSQGLSYSLDHGRTWRHYEHNPIMIRRERDPKAFWYAPSNHWVMVMYGDHQYHILTSTNLLHWKDEHNPIPDSYECPDFFELPVDGDPHHSKWVLIQGDGKYSLGSFNGIKFTPETGRYVCDIGPNFYATQTWNNTDTGDGRRIQAAWMRGANSPDMPFNQQVSFPCELTLRTTANGIRLFREPIKEIASLQGAPDSWTNYNLRANRTLRLVPAGRLFRIRAEVAIPDNAELIFDIRGVPVVLTSKTVESGTKPATVSERVNAVEILVDRASIETFVNRGEVSSTRFVLPHQNGLSVKAEGGDVAIRSLVVYPLKSAWNDIAEN